ncbi:primase-helicase family protein [Salibaculum griseiflavum]|uniref:NrS-1 polymerase-like helicase domain-containing protein n=1 Tax=Salibaculum griseiflavum TaxID=1914409 RepID=A0A2V1P069_9RHOB|nr:primase-helicase family protein [Salibaculum griseiflavum]PWG15835.1 hypothetical protein DFK10_14990 [Salibaculum griseiflavum]
MSENDFQILRISQGKHRGRVKNIQIPWRKFCRKFAEPSVDSSVTYGQYLKLGVDEQGEKKSAPGYIVGAQFADGKRRLANMQKRTLISFDLDEVKPAQMDEIEMGLSDICKYEFLRHTSRKHCPESPRWRIHMPISRPVDHDEANAITRILAAMIFSDPQESIDAVDVVSHRYAQVSYMPSRSKDQEYRCEVNHGELLDPDELLESFPGNWKDHTQLPMRSDESSARAADPNRRMELPTDKSGIMGAWCRTYTVDDCITEFLSDVYEPGVSTDGHNRYTYLQGTGSNGAVSYDDGLFLYSNHGTDPIEGAANAWDLCRIHLFGELDKDAREGTSPGSLPSFKAMAKFASEQEDVQIEIAREVNGLFDDADDEDEEEEADPAPGGRVKKNPLSEHEESDEIEKDDFVDTFEDDIDAFLGGSDAAEEDDIDAFLGGADEPEEKPKKKKKKKKKPLTLLEQMNRDHAFVQNGSTPLIADFRQEKKVNWRSVFGFQTEYRNRLVPDHEGKMKTLANWWLDHPKRQSYPLGVVFRPDEKVSKGMLNLWTGWAIEPDPAQDCQFILDYIWRILANQDQEHYDYLLSWLADIVQNPAQKPGVALVLKGLKGAGKDTLAEIMRRIVGDRHRAKITDTKMIGDKFNAAFETALIAQLEEASWGGNMDAKGTLQSYITSPTIRIERKGVDAIELDSFVRLIFTANEDWVVPATADERRYAVFEVSNERAGPKQKPFWRDFYSRLDNGGAEGFLAYLMEWERPDHIDVGTPPETKALSDQKLAGLRGVTLWWFGLLYDGEVPGDIVFSDSFEGDEDGDLDDPGWESDWVTVETNSVRAEYDQWRKNNIRKAQERDPRAFGKDLRTLCPSMERLRKGASGRQTRVYRLPPLDVCRAEFAAAQNVNVSDCGFPEFDGDDTEIDRGDLESENQ